MFFMEDMLLGKLPEFIPNLRLEKIKHDPDRILGLNAENKTLACVQGGLLYTGKFILSAVSDYSLEISVYPKYVGKSTGTPLWKETFRIMKKGDVLPLEIPFEKKIPFEYKSNLKGFEVTLELLQNDMHDISKKKILEKWQVQKIIWQLHRMLETDCFKLERWQQLAWVVLQPESYFQG